MTAKGVVVGVLHAPATGLEASRRARRRARAEPRVRRAAGARSSRTPSRAEAAAAGGAALRGVRGARRRARRRGGEHGAPGGLEEARRRGAHRSAPTTRSTPSRVARPRRGPFRRREPRRARLGRRRGGAGRQRMRGPVCRTQRRPASRSASCRSARGNRSRRIVVSGATADPDSRASRRAPGAVEVGRVDQRIGRRGRRMPACRAATTAWSGRLRRGPRVLVDRDRRRERAKRARAPRAGSPPRPGARPRLDPSLRPHGGARRLRARRDAGARRGRGGASFGCGCRSGGDGGEEPVVVVPSGAGRGSVDLGSRGPAPGKGTANGAGSRSPIRRTARSSSRSTPPARPRAPRAWRRRSKGGVSSRSSRGGIRPRFLAAFSGR